MKKCKQCGLDFIGRANQVLCSNECSHAARYKLSPIKCPTCGIEFKPENSRRKYCSRPCAAESHAGPASVKGMRERYKRVATIDGVRQLEHRVVMERVLGRSLLPGENVHHKNGNRFDNTPENLELWYRGQPSGQRVDDLIAYIVKHHRHRLALHLSALCAE